MLPPDDQTIRDSGLAGDVQLVMGSTFIVQEVYVRYVIPTFHLNQALHNRAPFDYYLYLSEKSGQLHFASIVKN